MTLRRVGLSNSLSSQAKISNKRFTLSRVSLRRFPFPTAAAAAAIPVYIEEVFSTFLYKGDNVAGRLIQNNIDLAGKGGLVWTKSRSFTWGSVVIDTTRETDIYGYKRLFTNSVIAAATSNFGLTAFNSNGYTLGGFDSGTGYNSPDFNNLPGQFGDSDPSYVSWTFRKQSKFFDIVTYTGNGSTQTINHNLGSTPGCIMIKTLSNDSTYGWCVFHRSTGSNNLVLNSTEAAGLTFTGDISNVTSSSFNVSSQIDVNFDGRTYVAYIFAHDAGGFGLTGSDNVITCGSFTTNGSGNIPSTNLGYEPQWILLKSSTNTQSWVIYDTMRKWSITNSAYLLPNSTSAEVEQGAQLPITSTGFGPSAGGWLTNTTYIYIAIRRGPMKTPTSGTSVFKPVRRTGNGSTTIISAGFPIDMSFTDTSAGTYLTIDRLRGLNYFRTISTDAEAAGGAAYDTQDGYRVGVGGTFPFNTNGTSYSDHFFRRAPGFFDIVCYNGLGSGSDTANIPHNLGVVPEMVIYKSRNNVSQWVVRGTFGFLILNSDQSALSSTPLPATTTTFEASASVNAQLSQYQSGYTYVAYLFASCPGVSKVGSYTGNGSSQTIDCGFTTGARYVLIKRTDSTGSWTVFDSALGIVGDNEVFGRFNSPGGVDSSATGDHIDPTSTGFIVNQVASSSINVNNATYIFLAIA